MSRHGMPRGLMDSRAPGILRSRRLALRVEPRLCLAPLLLQHAWKPEIDGGESEEEQSQPAHGLGWQEGPAFDRDVEPEEGIDDARQLEHHDPLLEPLVHH